MGKFLLSRPLAGDASSSGPRIAFEPLMKKSALISSAMVLLFCGACSNDPTPVTGRRAGETENSVTGQSSGKFGVQYIPDGFGPEWLMAADFFDSAIKPVYSKDLALMAGLGISEIKIGLGPDYGMTFGLNTTSLDTAKIQREFQRNIGTFLADAERYGMHVVIALLTNDMYLHGPEGFYPDNKDSAGQTSNWYTRSYRGLGNEAAARMGRDLTNWENAIVGAIAASGKESVVSRYELATEVAYGILGPEWDVLSHTLVQSLLRGVAVPPSKRGMDVIWPQEAPLLANDLRDTGVSLAFSELHSYPGGDNPANPDIAKGILDIRAALPGVSVSVGEFGSSFCKNGMEGQASILRSSLSTAASVNAGSLLNWGLWDYYPVNDCSVRDRNDSTRLGLGFSIERPRSVMGVAVEHASDLPGGDFETGDSRWSSGAQSNGASHSRETGDAATGQGYLRLRATQPGPAWLCSPTFAARGSKAVVGAYVRSGEPEVSLQLHYRDAMGWSFDGRQPVVKALASGAWKFRHVQTMADKDFSITLPAGTTEAIACFVVNAPAWASEAAPILLDLDTVGVRTF